MAVALYARVSTSKQAERDLSIPDQLAQMREYCRAHDLLVAQEYVEAGASALSDRRPVFQEMIADACVMPAPYEAILVHSLSRFYRDAIEFGLYERKLSKHGIRILSITQETADNPSGQFMRQVFSIFDQYQSAENSKHTLRAMMENARHGYFNGSTAPYGYRAVEVGKAGRSGQKRKLELDPAEAEIVRLIFDLYVSGKNGMPMGFKSIAEYLASRGIMRRGKPWRRGAIGDVLADRVYLGEYFFNKKCARSQQLKPRAEWISIAVPPVVTETLYTRAEERRHARQPEKVPPRRLSSPTLLTGLLKCGECGAGMTLATGKGGLYRYYKCTNRINKGNPHCGSGNVRMERLDDAVIGAVTDRLCQPDRLEAQLTELQARLAARNTDGKERLDALKADLDDNRRRTERLFDAVERGVFADDEVVEQRARNLQGQRHELLRSIARLEAETRAPIKTLRREKVQAFADALSRRMRDRQSPLAKQYLHTLVDSVTVRGQKVEIAGQYAPLIAAASTGKLDSGRGVPSYVGSWLPGPCVLGTARLTERLPPRFARRAA